MKRLRVKKYNVYEHKKWYVYPWFFLILIPGWNHTAGFVPKREKSKCKIIFTILSLIFNKRNEFFMLLFVWKRRECYCNKKIHFPCPWSMFLRNVLFFNKKSQFDLVCKCELGLRAYIWCMCFTMSRYILIIPSI